MKILAIETSCDETSIALIERKDKDIYRVHSHETISQIDVHKEFGGVYPALSRREHEKNLIPILHKVLKDSDMLIPKELSVGGKNELESLLGQNIELLERYDVLKNNILDFFGKFDIKKIDFIAVTNGPGLPPALWVGVNFAKVLSRLLGGIPLFPINHLEGHIIGAVSRTVDNFEFQISKLDYPVINLLISGGHTEIVLSTKKNAYVKIGETLDDAIGECYDKVARMLGLAYPGGPEISKLAGYGRMNGYIGKQKFPRPLIHSKDLNFSFSGLKTHILYLTDSFKKENSGILNEETKIAIATEFEEVVVDVLIKKVDKAIDENLAKTLVVGGGVASNFYIKEKLKELTDKKEVEVFLSDKLLATDNALMIALTCAHKIENGHESVSDFLAIGSKNYNQW